MPQVTPFDFGEEILNAGDTVSLTCTVGKGDLPLKIHWQLNDKILNSGNGVLINRNGKRISVLSIENVQHEHIGNYTCIAENEAGRSSHTAVLNVNGIKTNTSKHWLAFLRTTMYFYLLYWCIFVTHTLSLHTTYPTYVLRNILTKLLLWIDIIT